MRGRQASDDQSERSIYLSVENFSKSFCRTGDKAGEGSAYCNIGEAKRNLGQFAEAIEYQQKFLEIARQTGE